MCNSTHHRRGDGAVTVPLPLSGTCLTPPLQVQTRRFSQSSAQAQATAALSQGSTPLHPELPLVSSPCPTTRKASLTENTAFQVWSMALCLFALEMRRRRVTRKERGSFPRWLEAERAMAHAESSKGGCCFLAQQAGIYCAHPFHGKGLLNKTCWAGTAPVLFVGVSLPCTRVSSGAGAPAHLWTAPARCFSLPPSLPSRQEGLMVYLEIWEPEESSTVVGLSNCLSKTASRAAEPAATTMPEPVPSQALGFPSLRTLLLSTL